MEMETSKRLDFRKSSVNIIYKILEEYDRFHEIPFSNQVYNVSLRDEKQNKDVIKVFFRL